MNIRYKNGSDVIKKCNVTTNYDGYERIVSLIFIMVFEIEIVIQWRVCCTNRSFCSCNSTKLNLAWLLLSPEL